MMAGDLKARRAAERKRFDSLIHVVGTRKVRVSRAGIVQFNSCWPCSELRITRAYWFEFDADRNLVDTDCPQSDDGAAAVALSRDCEAWFFDGVLPKWAVWGTLV